MKSLLLFGLVLSLGFCLLVLFDWLWFLFLLCGFCCYDLCLGSFLLFLSLLKQLFLLKLFSLLFPDSNLHSFKLIEAVFDLEYNLISFLFLFLKFLGQVMVLFIGLLHSLLIFVGNRNDFIDWYCLCAVRTLLIYWNNVSDLLLQSYRLRLVLIHDWSCIQTNLVELIDGLLCDLFIFRLLLCSITHLNLGLLWFDILWLTLLHFLIYLNFITINFLICFWICYFYLFILLYYWDLLICMSKKKNHYYIITVFQFAELPWNTCRKLGNN